MTTLQQAIEAIKTIKIHHKSHKKTSIADELLGKYKGIIPKGKTSTQFVRELRDSSYGKFK